MGLFATVDDADFEWLSQHRWFAKKDRNTTYAFRWTPRNSYKRKAVFLHREIMGCVASDGKIIDHKDRNGLNCQRDNLRFATYSQNRMNILSAKNSSSQYKGVYFCKRDKVWVSAIRHNNKQTRIGNFKSEKEAALAYNKKAAELFGEFVLLNETTASQTPTHL